MNIDFSKLYHNFPAGFVTWIDLISSMHSSLLFIEDNGCFGHFILYHYRYRCCKLRSTLYAGSGKMVLWKALDISKTKIMRPYADAIAMLMWRERMPGTGGYDKVN